MAEIFSGAKLKIAWASGHITDLERSLVEHLRQGAGIKAFTKVENGRHSLYVEADPIPPSIGLLLGDVLHNLRASLDYVAWELVEAAGGTPSKKTYFPIAETIEKSAEIIDRGGIHIAGAKVRDTLLNVIKPYKGANPHLWALHGANNIDKHRLTVPVTAVTMLENFSARSGGLNIAGTTMGLRTGGQVSMLANMENEIHVLNLGTPALQVKFPRDSDFGDAPLFPTLFDVASTVRRAIQDVEEAWVAERA